MITSLMGAITIDWSVEWLGIVASAFILISFLFSKQVITRLINMVGCVAFVIYATVFIKAFSTAFMNGALFVVHVVFLVKDYVAKKRNQKTDSVAAEQNPSNAANDDTAQFDADQAEEKDTTDKPN